MKKITILVLALLQVLLTQAQYDAAVFDFEMAYFNNGQPLPAEKMLIFSGDIKGNIQAVEVEIYKSNGKNPLYTGLWQRSMSQGGESFRLPVNYRLQGNAEYDFRINYLTDISDNQKEEIEKGILSHIRFYQKQHIQLEKGKLTLKKPAGKLFTELNQILEEALENYRPAQSQLEIGFSSILGKHLKALEKDSLFSSVDELEALLSREVNSLLQTDWWGINIVREVHDYPTEKIGGALALNVGYGGILLSGQADNFTYGSAPYIGLSIPLSNKAYTSPILRNTSVSLGAFTQNLEGSNGETFTGPIFGRPYFAGLGYSVFRFIRFNAGMVVLEEKPMSPIDGENPSFEINRIKLQPFIGLSAEIKFSVGLNNR